MHDLGGMSYFTVALEKCEGDWDLMQAAMDGANKEVDEGGDDRKGGAGHLGKCFLSCDEAKHLALIYFLPKELQEGEKCVTLDEWIEVMTAGLSPEIVDKTETTARVICPQSTEKQLFPLKMRDTAINNSFAMLRSKELVADDDSGSEDDMGAMYEDLGIEW